MRSESSREPYAGSADAPVRNAPRGAMFVRKRRIISRFALIADEPSAFPAKPGFLILKLHQYRIDRSLDDC